MADWHLENMVDTECDYCGASSYEECGLDCPTREGEEVKQGTEEWLEFRKKHVGASDQTHLQMCAKWSMGWKKLWAIKTGREREKPAGPHMLAGIEAEPQARALYEAHILIFEGVSTTFHPSVVEHEFLSASLDGYSKTLNRIIEIKTPGAEDHETAVANKVPDKYIPQLTQQSLLMGKIPVDYVSYRNDQIAIVTFKPTEEQYKAVIDTAIKFWEFVEKDIEPDQNYPSPLFAIVKEKKVSKKLLAELAPQLLEALQEIVSRDKDPGLEKAKYLLSVARGESIWTDKSSAQSS